MTDPAGLDATGQSLLSKFHSYAALQRHILSQEIRRDEAKVYNHNAILEDALRNRKLLVDAAEETRVEFVALLTTMASKAAMLDKMIEAMGDW